MAELQNQIELSRKAATLLDGKPLHVETIYQDGGLGARFTRWRQTPHSPDVIKIQLYYSGNFPGLSGVQLEVQNKSEVVTDGKQVTIEIQGTDHIYISNLSGEALNAGKCFLSATFNALSDRK